MPCLLYVNLNRLINTHLLIILPKIVLLTLRPWFFMLKELHFLTLNVKAFVYKFTHAQKHLFWPALSELCSYREKNNPGETGFLVCKNETSIMENVPPSRDGIIFTCNQKYIFE